MKAYVTVGVSCAGKTTWATKFAESNDEIGAIVCRDDIRRQILCERKNVFALARGELWTKWKFNKNDEALVTRKAWDIIETQAAIGKSIIIADTNLNKHRNHELEQKLKKLEFDVEFVEFPIELEEAWKRDSARQDGVGHSVIYRQFQQWNDYIGSRKYTPNITKPKVILCDIDGTVSHMCGRRGPFDWDKVDLDSVDEVVKSIITASPYKVIFVSGRDAVCRSKTEKWLKDNGIDYLDLFMREENDARKDTIVKNEIFWDHIADNYNVQYVIDDRPVVVRLWMSLGIKVLNVGNPYIEF